MEEENRQLKALVLLLQNRLETLKATPKRSLLRKIHDCILITSSIQVPFPTAKFDRHRFIFGTEPKTITLTIEKFWTVDQYSWETVIGFQFDTETIVVTLKGIAATVKVDKHWFDEFESIMKQVALEHGMEEHDRYVLELDNIQRNYAAVVGFCKACREVLQNGKTIEQ